MIADRFAFRALALAAVALAAAAVSCSSDQATASHTHNTADVVSGQFDNARLHTGPGGGLDADLVDGMHGAAFSPAGHTHDTLYAAIAHNHDSSYLRLTGGTLTGPLVLPSGGLTVGTNQVVVSAAGYVGIGTASPSTRLEVSGTVLAIATTGHGVRGQTSDSASAGVYGNSSAGHGVEGVSSGANKNGVYGSASGSHGVYGVTSSASHSGVYGTSPVGDAIYGQCTGGGSGVVGTTTDANFAGVNGQSTAGHGVYGSSTASMRAGVYGLSQSNYGIIGETQNNSFAGIHGFSQVGDGVAGTTQAITTNFGGSFVGDVGVSGNILKTGTCSFMLRHPEDASKAIVYVCPEAGEVGTYCRGKARLASGTATVDLPDHFTRVTAEEGITVQVTPQGSCNGLYVEKCDNRQIVVRELLGGSGDVEFHWTVNGIRKGYENYDPVTDSPKVLKKLDQWQK